MTILGYHIDISSFEFFESLTPSESDSIRGKHSGTALPVLRVRIRGTVRETVPRTRQGMARDGVRGSKRVRGRYIPATSTVVQRGLASSPEMECKLDVSNRQALATNRLTLGRGIAQMRPTTH
jgi:hypothetical protein